MKLRALNNPIRHAIVTALRALGEASAGEIAAHVGEDAQLIHYHLRLLVESGLISRSHVRPATTKPKIVFSAKEPVLVDTIDLDDPQVRKEVQRNVATVASAAGRDYARAIEDHRNEAHDSCSLFRIVCSLTLDQRAELSVRVMELTNWLISQGKPDGEKYTFTLLVSPLD